MLIVELDTDRVEVTMTRRKNAFYGFIRRHVSQNKKDKGLIPELCFVVIEHNQQFILSTK